jgi:hypothetical protein
LYPSTSKSTKVCGLNTEKKRSECSGFAPWPTLFKGLQLDQNHPPSQAFLQGQERKASEVAGKTALCDIILAMRILLKPLIFCVGCSHYHCGVGTQQEGGIHSPGDLKSVTGVTDPVTQK